MQPTTSDVIFIKGERISFRKINAIGNSKLFCSAGSSTASRSPLSEGAFRYSCRMEFMFSTAEASPLKSTSQNGSADYYVTPTASEIIF